jgi:hypothetical protein
MTCDDVKPRLKRYGDDLLPEDERVRIRTHLTECRACRENSFSSGDFSADLRRLAFYEPPRGLQEKVLRDFERSSLERVRRKKFSPWMFFAGIALAFLAWGIWLQIHSSWQSNGEPNKKAVLSAPQESTLRTQDPFKMPLTADPLQSSKYDIALRPFHWDIEFSDLEGRSAFLTKLRTRHEVLVPHYEAPFLVVFSAQRNDLKDILSLLAELGAGTRRGGPLPSFLPEYSGLVRISMSLGVPQSRISQTLLHHWHFKFDLPNKFTLKERLREAGAKFLYEAPEVWVIEIRGKNFDQMLELVQNTHGLITDIGKAQFISTQSYRDIPVRISLYIDEG